MDEYIDDNELLTRFLEGKKHFQLPHGPIKVKAFHPSNKHGTVSVFRTVGCSEQEVWALADTAVAPNLKDFSGRFEARADLIAHMVRRVGLEVVPEPTDHERHADITGWIPSWMDLQSEEGQSELRERRHDLAVALMQAAMLRLRAN